MHIDEHKLVIYSREHLAPHGMPKHWITVDDSPTAALLTAQTRASIEHLHDGGSVYFPRSEEGMCGSPNWTRTNNPSINSRMLCQLSYGGL